MKTDLQPRFRRAYKKLTDRQRLAVDDALKRFLADPRDKPLHFEKLLNDIHSIRADNHGLRIIMRRVAGNEYALLDVGLHDVQDQYGHGQRS